MDWISKRFRLVTKLARMRTVSTVNGVGLDEGWRWSPERAVKPSQPTHVPRRTSSSFIANAKSCGEGIFVYKNTLVGHSSTIK